MKVLVAECEALVDEEHTGSLYHLAADLMFSIQGRLYGHLTMGQWSTGW